MSQLYSLLFTKLGNKTEIRQLVSTMLQENVFVLQFVHRFMAEVLICIIFAEENGNNMKKWLLEFACVALAAPNFCVNAQDAPQSTTIRLFDEVVFYDGYVMTNWDKVDAVFDDDILRHRTSLYAVKMTDEQLDAFGETTEMNVTIGALCDNYDRIGNVNLAFVPKGQEAYTPDDVQRIELGRFITPFMNKNRTPNEVPYSYQVDYLGYLMHDSRMRAQYDYWMEFELFGIPYAANEQVSGCAGRNDVFAGTLEFVTSMPGMEATDKNVIVPIVIKKPEYIGKNLNNYSEEATDEIGKTIKTYTFTLEEDVEDGMLALVTSNHGANAREEGDTYLYGEEYCRRWHYIYMDGDEEPILTYMPGRTSCEPFRKYNTQANGIYGSWKKSEAQWQSFSNWCPGDVIDNRIIRLGAVKAGTHTVTISVPDAVFLDNQGDIPVSLFFQGLTEGKLPENASIAEPEFIPSVAVSQRGDVLYLQSDKKVTGVELYTVSGQCRYEKWAEVQSVPLSGYASGVYLLNVYLEDGIIETHKIMKR